MSVKTTFNEGKLLRAGRLITVDGRNYVATDVKTTKPTREHVSYNELDMPDGAFQTDDFKKLTATLIGKTDVAEPARHETFVYDSTTWVIGAVDVASGDNDVTKYSVSAREVINVPQIPVTFSANVTNFTSDGGPHGPTIVPSVVGATYEVIAGSLFQAAPGNYSVTVRGTGVYVGESTINYSISAPLTQVSFSAAPLTFAFDGTPHGPTVTSNPPGVPYTPMGTAVATAVGQYSFTPFPMGPGYQVTSGAIAWEITA